MIIHTYIHIHIYSIEHIMSDTISITSVDRQANDVFTFNTAVSGTYTLIHQHVQNGEDRHIVITDYNDEIYINTARYVLGEHHNYDDAAMGAIKDELNAFVAGLDVTLEINGDIYIMIFENTTGADITLNLTGSTARVLFDKQTDTTVAANSMVRMKMAYRPQIRYYAIDITQEIDGTDKLIGSVNCSNGYIHSMIVPGVSDDEIHQQAITFIEPTDTIKIKVYEYNLEFTTDIIEWEDLPAMEFTLKKKLISTIPRQMFLCGADCDENNTLTNITPFPDIKWEMIYTEIAPIEFPVFHAQTLVFEDLIGVKNTLVMPQHFYDLDNDNQNTLEDVWGAFVFEIEQVNNNVIIRLDDHYYIKWGECNMQYVSNDYINTDWFGDEVIVNTDNLDNEHRIIYVDIDNTIKRGITTSPDITPSSHTLTVSRYDSDIDQQYIQFTNNNNPTITFRPANRPLAPYKIKNWAMFLIA